MKVWRVTFSVRNDLHIQDHREVPLWAVGTSIEHAIRKCRAYARKNFDDKRAKVTGAVHIGTVDVP